MALSGIGMFMIVFALQEGQSHDWAPWVWGTIAGGIFFMAAFLVLAVRSTPTTHWSRCRSSATAISRLSNIGVATIGFVVTAMIVPVMFYAQAVCGLSPTRSALVVAPMAIATGVLAPFVGRIVDRSHPRPVIGFGFSLVAISMTWLSIEMTPTTAIWRIVLPLTVTGIGMAFIWSPLAATATRNLPPQLAGAGSGVYNTTRQVGSVLGSAGMAAFMTWRISAELPPVAVESPRGEGAVALLPAFLHEPFSAAMSQTLLLPAFIALFGVGAALFLLGFGDNRSTVFDDPRAADPDFGTDESFTDDDEYLEYTVSWDDAEPVTAKTEDAEPVTEPMASRVPHVLHAPADVWHDEPVDTWHHVTEDEQPPAATAKPTPAREPDGGSWRWGHRPPEGQGDILDILLAEDRPPPPAKPVTEPIGFAHNGFHVDDEQRFQPVDRRRPIAEPGSPAADAYSADLSDDDYSASGSARHRVGGHHERPSRHRLREEDPEPRQFWFDSNGRHSRDDPDEGSRHGRHSSPWRD